MMASKSEGGTHSHTACAGEKVLDHGINTESSRDKGGKGQRCLVARKRRLGCHEYEKGE